MAELALRHQVQLALSRLGARLFRVNTGQAWVGKRVMSPAGNTVVLSDARPMRMGLTTGGSDLIGWTPHTITAADVGRRVAIFTAIELKTGRAGLSREQAVFLDAVCLAGGLAGVARSVEDARAILAGGEANTTSGTTHP